MRFTCNSFAVALLLAAALHADDRRCATCHPKEVAGYAKSAMAASLSVAANQPAGAFDHALSSTKFTIRATPEGQIQSYQRGSESSEHRVAYVIGSGAHAFGYLVQIGDHLFQSPLSYYSSLRTWDVAPGYEESKQPDFSRPVTPECLLCHAEQPRPIPDTVNRYETPPVVGASISCERCHGTVEAHEKNPVPGSIVNPAKLQAAARDSVCEQCHLSGEVRIPNPGKSIADFQPGQRLEDSYSVYVAAHPPGTTVKVISHVEQLALSLCSRSSGGKLWCGTCHDPHDKPIQPAAYFRDRCLTCHAATLEKSHAAPGRDCVSCHMPRLDARDGGHTAFTDHRIARNPKAPTPESKQDGLKAWREPDSRFRDRNLAIALVTVGLQDASSDEVIRGYRMLNQVEKVFPDDPAALTSLGTVLLRAKQPAEALRRFEKVVTLKPDYSPYRVNAALALIALGRKAEAEQQLNHALGLDPLLETAVQVLSAMYRGQGDADKAADLRSRYKIEMGITTTSPRLLDRGVTVDQNRR